MQNTASKIVHVAAWCGLAGMVMLSLLWCHIGRTKDGYSGLAFYVVGPGFSILALLLGVIPSAIFYSRDRQRRDLISLVIWTASVLVVMAETVALYRGVFGGLRMT